MELMFKKWLLTEKSRWKREGLSSSAAGVLKTENDLIQKIKEYPNAFLSFRGGEEGITKIGINPGVEGEIDPLTPIGIFAFPISCVKLNNNSLNIHSGRNKLIYIFKPKPGIKILEIRNKFGNEAKIYHQATFRQTPAKMANNFIKLGYGGVIDWGSGMISELEPCQAVFFGEQFIQVIEQFENPLFSGNFWAKHFKALDKQNKALNKQKTAP